jgi:hypothetical protein
MSLGSLWPSSLVISVWRLTPWPLLCVGRESRFAHGEVGPARSEFEMVGYSPNNWNAVTERCSIFAYPLAAAAA